MRTLVQCGIVLALLPATAAAQNDCLKDFKMPAVGSWAEYKGTYRTNEPTTWRYAVIGSETRDGKELKWLEFKTTGDKADKNMVYQMLTPGTPAEFGQVEDAVRERGRVLEDAEGLALPHRVERRLDLAEGGSVAGAGDVVAVHRPRRLALERLLLVRGGRCGGLGLRGGGRIREEGARAVVDVGGRLLGQMPGHGQARHQRQQHHNAQHQPSSTRHLGAAW